LWVQAFFYGEGVLMMMSADVMLRADLADFSGEGPIDG